MTHKHLTVFLSIGWLITAVILGVLCFCLLLIKPVPPQPFGFNRALLEAEHVLIVTDEAPFLSDVVKLLSGPRRVDVIDAWQFAEAYLAAEYGDKWQNQDLSVLARRYIFGWKLDFLPNNILKRGIFVYVSDEGQITGDGTSF